MDDTKIKALAERVADGEPVWPDKVEDLARAVLRLLEERDELLARINAQIELVRVLNLDHDAEIKRLRSALECARAEIQHEPELAGCLAVIDNALEPGRWE